MLYHTSYFNYFIIIFTDENIDETYGINVQFEESEEEDDDDAYGEVKDEQEDVEDTEGIEAELSQTLKTDVSNKNSVLFSQCGICDI